MNTTKQSGFTLIEMIVSLALFAVVVTVAVGALLVLVGTNDELQGEQAVMTNLSFAMDSMTREIRTGTRYKCVTATSQTGVFNDGNSLEAEGQGVDDCEQGNAADSNFHGVSFIEAGDSITGETGATRILYYYNGDENSDGYGKIFRRVGDESAQSLVASGIVITKADFFVSGSESVEDPSGDTSQPAVTIHIEAVDENDLKQNQKVYFLQTTVTQRTLDI